jgi:hypothetical protein
MTVEVTVADLANFLRGGGVVSLDEWVRLDDTTKARLGDAGVIVSAERAMLYAAACRPDGVRHVAQIVDGGQASEEADLADALNRGLARVTGRGV